MHLLRSCFCFGAICTSTSQNYRNFDKLYKMQIWAHQKGKDFPTSLACIKCSLIWLMRLPYCVLGAATCHRVVLKKKPTLNLIDISLYIIIALWWNIFVSVYVNARHSWAVERKVYIYGTQNSNQTVDNKSPLYTPIQNVQRTYFHMWKLITLDCIYYFRIIMDLSSLIILCFCK